MFGLGFLLGSLWATTVYIAYNTKHRNRRLQRKNMLDEKCYLYYRNVEDLHSYIDSIYTPAYAEKLRRHRKKL